MPNGNTGVYVQAIESEWDWIENMLIALSDDEPDEYERYLLWEAVRVPKYGSTHRTQVRVSKVVK